MAVCFYRGRGLNNGGEVQFVVVSVWESGEHWRLEGCKTASGVLSTRVCCWARARSTWGAAADNSVGNNKCLGAGARDPRTAIRINDFS